MDYREVNIYTKSEAVDILIAQLSDYGIVGFVIHDSADFKEFVENKSANWDYIDDDLLKLKNQKTHITAYLPADVQGAELLNGLKGVLADLRVHDTEELYGTLDTEISSVNEEDWANNWKQYFKPFNVGNKFLIKPSWEEVADTNGRMVLEIDPASSFGTGQHHTTKLCIEALEGIVEAGDTVLDLGCGSGILSIAALLLGARHVTAVDVFQNAVVTAEENIVKNGFDNSRFNTFCGNIIEDPVLKGQIASGYNIICANIVADVIIAMTPLFRSFLVDSGKIILSGIITERLTEVKEALAAEHIVIESLQQQEGWNELTCSI